MDKTDTDKLLIDAIEKALTTQFLRTGGVPSRRKMAALAVRVMRRMEAA